MLQIFLLLLAYLLFASVRFVAVAISIFFSVAGVPALAGLPTLMRVPALAGPCYCWQL
jgi:hypothetical protein